MHKFIKLIWGSVLLALVYISPSHACDGGCPTVTSYYNGLFPQYQKHFIGLRWRFNSVSSVEQNVDLGLSDQIRESFHSFELMGRFYPHKRIQIMAFVPINYNLMTDYRGQQQLFGLGDASILVLYNIFNSDFRDSTISKVQQSLLVGVGVKMPTGNFNKRATGDILFSPTFQLGTGSTDFIFSIIYTLRYKKVGFNSNITYKANLANKNQYKIGNQLTGRVVGFGLLESKGWMFVPQLGLQVEHNAKNSHKEFIRKHSGGSQLVGILGLSVYFKKIQIGISYEQPIWQNNAEEQVENNARFMANINYLF